MDFSDMTPNEFAFFSFAMIVGFFMIVAMIHGIVLCFRASRTLGIVSIFALCTGFGPFVLALFGVVRLFGGVDLAKRVADWLNLSGQ